MITLISPAKNLDFESPVPTKYKTQISFEAETFKLVKKLKKLSANKIGELMKLSDKLAQLNYERYQAFEEVFPEADSRQAIFAFNGEVYTGLDAYSMNEQNLDFAQRHLRILSGLYGVLSPLDNILPYRLEMGTKFSVTPSVKNLYQFWGDKIAKKLNQDLETSGNSIILNLASNEYFKAVDKKTIDAEIITPVFKDFKNGTYKTIMMFAKKARGSMSRFVIDNEINTPEEVKAFDIDGYGFNAELSKDNEWVFTRG